MKLPPSSKSWILRYRWVVEGLSALAVSLAGCIGSVLVVKQLDEANRRMLTSDGGDLSYLGLWFTWTASGIAAIAAGWRLLAGFIEHRAAARVEVPHDLYAACFVMRGMLLAEDGSQADTSLRVTVFRVSGRGKKGSPIELEQITPYAHDGADNGEAGRTFPTHCGVIGRVAKLKQPTSACRVSADADSFRAEMVREWGYSLEEAAGLDDTRWSWMGVPLIDRKDRVAGVIFLDTRAKDYFTEDRFAAVLEACMVVRELALERYP